MDSSAHIRNRKRRSNKEHRLRADKRDNFPNGYLEDPSVPSDSSIHNNPASTIVTSTRRHSPTHSNHRSKPLNILNYYPTHELQYSSNTKRLVSSPGKPPKSSSHIKSKDLIIGKDQESTNYKFGSFDPTDESVLSRSINEYITKKDCSSDLLTKSSKFNPVSIILSTQNNILLTKENSYDVRFSTGMIEGSGLSINQAGNLITFQDEGSYRFEISGEATPFSDVDVKLIYYSPGFSEDIRAFSEIIIPKDEGKLQLRGIPTILPIQKGQTIIPRLIPNPDESIVLMANTKLLIHRVA